MKRTTVWILAVLNVLLLAGLVGRFTHANSAEAQVEAQRRVSDYLMVPMELTSGQAGLVCIIDENAGRMSAVAYNGRGGLDVMPPLELRTPTPAVNNTPRY